jgi:hypothetical protein
MRLNITNYSETPDLDEVIVRYYTLLQMTFATNIYKIFETPESQVVRFMVMNTFSASGCNRFLRGARPERAVDKKRRTGILKWCRTPHLLGVASQRQRLMGIMVRSFGIRRTLTSLAP